MFGLFRVYTRTHRACEPDRLMETEVPPGRETQATTLTLTLHAG
jgi:hypothetical protein